MNDRRGLPSQPLAAPRTWQTSLVIMTCGALVFMLSAGTRQTFGLFLHPMTTELGWNREVFALAIACLTLLTGATTPFMGLLADRYGSARVILFGGAMWAIGLFAMANSTTPVALWLSAGIVVGLGASATSVSIAIGAVGKRVPMQMRSRALGIVAAGGSVGQMLMLPLAQGLILWQGWKLGLMLLGGVMVMMILAALGLSGRPPKEEDGPDLSIAMALREAGRHRGFWLLSAGFFVCGYHVSFIAVHLPSFVIDQGIDPSIGAGALFLIGSFNVLGSYSWGRAGGHLSKKRLLSALYLTRAAVISVFYLVEPNTTVVLVFAAAMGFLWLGTVPLTSGLVGQIFGVRYLSMLFGIVFFSHQLGGFLGAWSGGYVFDTTGSYDLVWLFAIALGIASAALHWPINETPLVRAAAR